MQNSATALQWQPFRSHRSIQQVVALLPRQQALGACEIGGTGHGSTQEPVGVDIAASACWRAKGPCKTCGSADTRELDIRPFPGEMNEY